MQGRWPQWVTNVANGAKAVGGMIKNAWQSETFRTNAQTFSLQAWAGISFSSFFSAIPTSIQYVRTRAPLWGQAPDGMTSFGGFIPDNTVITALDVLLVEQLLAHAVRLVPGVEGSYLEYGLYAFDAAAYLYLLQRTLNRHINKAFYQLAIAKEATPDPELLKRKLNKHLLFKPCSKKCGETASTMADVMRIPEGVADMIFSYSIANACSLLFFNLKQPLPYINAMVLYPLLSLKYGRDILNAKLSSVGMCETHRNEIITANNAYCIGKGASLLFGVYAAPKVIGWALDQYGYSWASALINSEFFVSGLFALSYTSFVQAELQITNTLPGTKPGVDIFRYVHVAAQEATKWATTKIVSLCWNPNSSATWDEQLENIRQVYQSTPVKLAMTLCVGEDALSLRAFLNRPAVHSFTNAYEKTIKENVEWINGLRSGRIPDFVLKILPERVLSETTKTILLALRSKEMDGPAKSMNDLLEKIYPGKFPAIPPKSTMVSKEKVEMFAKADGVTEEVAKFAKLSDNTLNKEKPVPNLGFLGRASSGDRAPVNDDATQNFTSFLKGLKSKHE